MTKVAIIRCEKNMDRCPMTNCIRCVREQKEAFSIYDQCVLTGIFTCRCPGDTAGALAKILKTKGAEVVHFCTCTFANKTSQGWTQEKRGFCDNIDAVIERASKEADIPCIKGSAHLPQGYTVKA